MFIVATVLGIYLENGEAQIQSLDTLPHFEETAVFQSLGDCEEYLFSQAKEDAKRKIADEKCYLEAIK